MPELRKDPMTGRWRIIAGGRSARPNEYATGGPSSTSDSDCPFCEGRESRTPPEVAAERPSGGVANGPAWTIRSFPNRFPTVTGAAVPGSPAIAGIFETTPAAGVHEVIVTSPTHAPALAMLPPAHLRSVFRFFRERVLRASLGPAVAATLLFENKGPESGGTLPHPHAQLLATEVVPPRLAEERDGFRGAKHRGDCLLESVVRAEQEAGVREIATDRLFAVIAPFASEHPYEAWIVPHRHAATFAEASDDEVDRLAGLLPAMLRALEEIRPGASYNWIVHGLGTPGTDRPEFHWHVEIAPRLVRADGFELGGGIPVNPVPPEQAAAELREGLASATGGGSPQR